LVVPLTHRSLRKTTRSVFALVFALLLIAMQQEASWHAVAHLPASLGDASVEHALQLPGEPCLECSLLASTTDFVAPGAAPLPPVGDPVAAEAPILESRLASTQFHYRSRAPPSPA
jgi:hypothetical protein